MNEEPNIVKIKFHGNLGKRLKRKNWDLAVSSVREAFRAVDVLSKRKLTKCLIKDTEKNLKYQKMAKSISLRKMSILEKISILKKDQSTLLLIILKFEVLKKLLPK